MKYQRAGSTYILRLERGEEVVGSVLEFCEKQDISCAEVTGLGAADHAVVGLYRVAERKYYSNAIEGEHEITSMVGNVSRKDGKPYLHMHAAFADAKGHVWGGHLNEARVSATAELFLRLVDGNVGRFVDEETGLNLMEL